jgi:hypothetical protein
MVMMIDSLGNFRHTTMTLVVVVHWELVVVGWATVLSGLLFLLVVVVVVVPPPPMVTLSQCNEKYKSCFIVGASCCFFEVGPPLEAGHAVVFHPKVYFLVSFAFVLAGGGGGGKLVVVGILILELALG